MWTALILLAAIGFLLFGLFDLGPPDFNLLGRIACVIFALAVIVLVATGCEPTEDKDLDIDPQPTITLIK